MWGGVKHLDKVGIYLTFVKDLWFRNCARALTPLPFDQIIRGQK